MEDDEFVDGDVAPEVLDSLQYNLRLHLHATSARLLSATPVEDDVACEAFERRSGRLTQAHCWVNTASLPAPNAMHGWQLPAGGIKVAVGKLVLSGSADTKTHRYVLCRLGIGRPFFATEEEAREASAPDGYDAFVLPPVANDDNVTYYWIKDSAQLLRLYSVTFEYDPDLEIRSRERPVCEGCRKNIATVYSTLYHANLCTGCAAEMHPKNHLAAKFSLLQTGQDAPVFGSCRSHPDRELEFYCPRCRVPVCVLCKMVGHHSSLEASQHRLVSMMDAYQDALQHTDQREASVLARRATLENQEQSLLARQTAIVQNVADVRQHLDEMYQRAVQRLESIAAYKVSAVRSDMLEVKRQRKWLDRLESFHNYQKTGRDATLFMFSRSEHQRQLQAALTSQPTPPLDVEADIKCVGVINVLTGVDAENIAPASAQKTVPRRAAMSPTSSEAGPLSTPMRPTTTASAAAVVSSAGRATPATTPARPGARTVT